MLIIYELWAGERLSLEKTHPRYLRPKRPISVSAVPFGPGIDIWRSCRFIGALMRSICLLPGGLRRFVPCSIGANHCRLRHIGWEKCGHGIPSRPRESASELSLDELLGLFRYPPVSGRALLAGTLPFGFVLRVLLVELPLGGCQFLVVLLSLYRAILGQQLHPSRPSCPTSRASHHGECLHICTVDAMAWMGAPTLTH